MCNKTINIEIEKNLFELSDEKYKKFHSSLCPGIENIIGIKVPILRNYAKKIIKIYSIEELLTYIEDNYYEKIMLKGMLIGLSNESIGTILEYIKNFVSKINSWAICDTFCSGLKITKKYKKEIWKLIIKYSKSNKEYEIRFAVVMILNYYINEEYLEKDFEIFNSINNDGYYVKMAVAWAISVALIKFYNNTVKYLENCKLDYFTYNKAIQKAIESYRITDNQKQSLKEMKKRTKSI